MWVLIICVNIYNSKHALNIFSEKVLFNLIFLNYYFKQKPLTLVSGSSFIIKYKNILTLFFIFALIKKRQTKYFYFIFANKKDGEQHVHRLFICLIKKD